MNLLLPACSQRVVATEQFTREKECVPHTERSGGILLVTRYPGALFPVADARGAKIRFPGNNLPLTQVDIVRDATNDSRQPVLRCPLSSQAIPFAPRRVFIPAGTQNLL